MSSPVDVASPWGRACCVAALFAINPLLSGVGLRAGAGPVRDAWLAALREWLDPCAPICRVPIGVSDDRLLGGLDLVRTLRAGRPIAQAGILAEADGGVLLLAMAERISVGTAARIASASDIGFIGVERDGLKLRQPARFGIVAFDEGQGDDERPPPALMDRLAYIVDLNAVSHREIEERPFTALDVNRARAALADIIAEDAVVETLVAVAAKLGVTSLRAALNALRSARAAAALRGAPRVEEQDIAVAAALVFGPRATQIPAAGDPAPDQEPSPEPESPPDDTESDGSGDSPDSNADDISPSDLATLVLSAARAAIPPDLLRQIALGQAARAHGARSGKSGAAMPSAHRGRPIGARRGTLRLGRLGVVDTLRAAAPWQGVRRAARPADDPRRVLVRPDDFRIIRFRERRGTTAIFVVDASGSSAMQRLAEAKGAIETLLADCYVRRDQVALVAFRGYAAELMLPPTRSLARAKRALAGLPGGGGTPIAHGVDAALALAEQIKRRGQSPMLVLMTDGRANIGREGARGRAQAMADALDAARRVGAAGVAALAIDTAPASQSAPEPPTLLIARAMNAHYVKLPHADPARVSDAVRAAAPRASR